MYGYKNRTVEKADRGKKKIHLKYDVGGVLCGYLRPPEKTNKWVLE